MKNNTITLSESHDFKSNSLIAKELKNICFKSKNLYNSAIYLCRQNFFECNYGLNYETLYHKMKSSEAYKDLPSKVSQQSIKQAATVFRSYIQASKSYRKNPNKFLGKPKLPRYKDKLNGQFVTTYTIQAISKKDLKDNIVSLSGTNLKFKTKQSNNIQQVRIVPKKNYYIVEIIYKKECINKKLNKNRAFCLDLGVNNLLSITSNQKGFIPTLVNGRIVKSINQFYNKQKSLFQSVLPKGRHSSKRIDRLSYKRSKKIKHYFHHVSKFLINLCIKEDAGIIVIGKNDNWKQKVNIGKVNNQNFVSLPFNILLDQICYKAKLVGIEVIKQEESYTSKCSFLDLEEICKHEEYLGYRKSRGMFRSKKFGEINADVNGSYNILRKVFPKSFDKGIEGFVVNPLFYTICKA
jgi:putative transposase